MAIASLSTQRCFLLFILFLGGKWEAEFWLGEGKNGKDGSGQSKHEKFYQ
jgi:hypothetical protein